MTFMDTSEGIKTDHSDMESINCCSNNILKLYPFTLQTLQTFKFKNVPNYPLFLNESGSTLRRANCFFFISNTLHSTLGFDLTGFGLFFPRALISYCGQYVSAFGKSFDKTLLRWASDCYRTYIHTPEQVFRMCKTLS